MITSPPCSHSPGFSMEIIKCNSVTRFTEFVGCGILPSKACQSFRGKRRPRPDDAREFCV
eukprot:6201407-Pyramimonas_sp.AAC.2